MAALEREPKVDVHHYPIAADFDSGVLTLEGNVKDIAAKKLALERGGAVARVTGIVDRLKVFAAEHMTDTTQLYFAETATHNSDGGY